jgi:hypothetical protein
MTEKFDSQFHKSYVRGEGEVAEDTRPVEETRFPIGKTTFEELLASYRAYVHDEKAELPETILKDLLSIQRTENDRK